MPSAISVHMLGERFRTDASPRRKKARAIHSTGVASRHCRAMKGRGPTQAAKGMPAWLPISSANTAAAKGAASHSRRRRSISSGLGPASAAGVMGSSAMPHFGQSPGTDCTTSGSIGQV